MPETGKNIVRDVDLSKGRLITSFESPAIGFGNYSIFQNMEYTDRNPRGIPGMTKVNTTALATYTTFVNACHFKKAYPTAESHVLAQVRMPGTPFASGVIDNITAIPSQGDFTETLLHTDTVTYATSGLVGDFNPTVDGSVIYCNGTDSVIWAGNEYRCGGFVVTNAAITTYFDYTEQINNSLTDATNVATLLVDTTITYFVISTRRLKGFKITMGSTVNAVASTAAVSYYNSSGVWTAVSNLVDGTASSGKTHAQTGTISFDSTVSTANLCNINGTIGYGYKVVITTGAGALTSGITISKVTVDAPFQTITDIWDGEERTLFSVQTYEGAYVDFTTNVAENTYDSSLPETFLAMAGGFSTTESIVFGAEERLMGVIIHMPPDGTKVGTTATTVAMKYWDGDSWVACSGVNDTTVDTDTRTKPFNQSGMITWIPPAFNSEKLTQIGNEKKLYYYQITVAANIGVAIRIIYMKGVAAPVQIRGHRFSTTWQNRPVLCCEDSNGQNTLWVGGSSQTAVWNGLDTVRIPIGENTPITAAMPMFIRYGSNYNEILIVCTQDETWVGEGTSPIDYQFRRISNKYGCLARETMDLCDLGVQVSPETAKQYMLWASASGLVKCDGYTVTMLPLDKHDLFTPTSANYINTAVADKFYGCYSPNNKKYAFVYADGENTTMNKEITVDLQHEFKFAEVNRGTGKAIQGMFTVSDTLGNRHLYGFLATQYMERLNYGNTFDGNAIIQKWRICLSPISDSFFFRWYIKWIKLFAKKKTTTSNDITLTHYGDANSATTPAIPDMDVAASTIPAMGMAFERWKRNLGPHYYHELEFSLTTSDETIGFEPYNLAIMADQEEEP